MINVCHFANHLQGKMDGVFNHIMMILKYSDNKKFKHYLFFQGDEFIENEFQKFGGKVIIIKSIAKKISLRVFREFYKQIKANNIQIIHTHFLKPYAIAGLMNIFLKRKLLHNYHGLFIDNSFYNFFEKIIYKTIHYIINKSKSLHLILVPSIKSKELLLNETGLFKEIEIYYNGSLNSETIPSVEIINTLLKTDEFKVVFAARLEDEKKLDFAIRIISRCKDLNILLYILGDGSLRKNYEDLAVKLGVDNKVHFLGYIPSAKSYLQYFDLLLITSASEGLPFVLWEAMESSIPIVASDVGGIKEIVTQENCGMIFKFGDFEDAVKKLKILYENRELTKTMGINGHNAIKNKYTPSAFGKKINNFYNNLLNNGYSSKKN